MILDKYDIALTRICAKDDNKPVLQDISLRNGQLVACDGFTLAKRKADTTSIQETTRELLLPSSILKQIKLDSNKQAMLVLPEEESTEFNITITRYGIPIEPRLIFNSQNIGTFPNYSHLIEGGLPKKAQVAISVSALKNILSMLPNDGVLQIGINEPTQAVEFYCKGGRLERDTQVFAMPLFTEFTWPRDTK